MNLVLEMLSALTGIHNWSAFGAGALVVVMLWQSFWTIGPTEVGLVRKRFAFKRLADANPVAFNGEAGYQSELLMPGLRFKPWPIYQVSRHPMVQIGRAHV